LVTLIAITHGCQLALLLLLLLLSRHDDIPLRATRIWASEHATPRRALAQDVCHESPIHTRWSTELAYNRY